jgi:hypothetical protein
MISEKTAGRHVSNLFSKLDVRNRAQATRIAVERGVTSRDGVIAARRMGGLPHARREARS